MSLIPFRAAARPTPDDDPEEDDLDRDDGASGGKMSFLEHLDELRRRLVVAVSAIGVGFLIAFAFIGQIFAFIMRPLQQILPAGGKLVYTEPTEAFMLQLKVAALADW
jgi:sec-independent protein translocase protein TatC